MAIALVASVKGASTGTSFTTSSINTTGATLLVATMTYFNSNAMGQLTDSNNNTWTPLPRRFLSDTAQRMFYCSNPVVGSGHTFSVNSGNFSSLVVAAFSGVVQLAAVDVTNGATGSGSTLATGSVTPANTNSLIVATVGYRNSGPTLSSIDSGFTIIDTDTTSGTLHSSMAYIVETSIVAKNPTWTFSGGLNAGTEIAVFIAGTVTPPSTPALVASVQASGTNPFTTGAIDTTGATVLIANLTGFSGTGIISDAGTPSDSKGNTWIGLTGRKQNTNYVQRLFYCINPTVGSGHTFTSTGNLGSIQVGAFSGVTGFDVEAGGNGTGDGQPGSITPSNNGSLIVSGLALRNALQYSLGVDQDFKYVAISPPTGAPSTSVGGILSFLAQGTAAALNPTTTFDGLSIDWAGNNAVFTSVPSVVNIPIPKGTLTLTTFAPGVAIGVTVPATSMAFTTFAPAVTISVAVPAGAIAITTYAPTVVQTGFITVPVGSLALTGFAPRVAIGIEVPTATLTITTYVPDVASDLNIEIPKATLAFTTYAPFLPEFINVPTGHLTLTTYAPAVGGTTIISIPVGHLTLTTFAPTVFIGNIGPCDDRFGPKVYFWEPSYLERPEDTFLRATDWDSAGYNGMKFVQGLIIEADTEGQTREILLQGDQADIETLTINHNGQIEKPYSLNQPVLKHLLRLLPTDDAFWRLFNVRWVYEPAPEYAREWKTQGTDHDIPGFQFLKDGYIAHASTADITLNITVDDTTFTYTIPHSSGAFVKTYLIFGIHPNGRTTKGTLFTYELTSSEPFQLYQKDCEVRVHDWSGGEYVVKQPFGDISRVYGARI